MPQRASADTASAAKPRRANAKRRLFLQLRKQIKIRRRLSAELLVVEPQRSQYRWTCKTCGHRFKRWEAVAAPLAKKMERYWQDGGTSGYCPVCTKRHRDERYPLPPLTYTARYRVGEALK